MGRSVRMGIDAVSYTHLDVYKRQLLRPGVFLTGMSGALFTVTCAVLKIM